MIKRIVMMVSLAVLALPFGAARAQDKDISGCGNVDAVSLVAKIGVDLHCTKPITTTDKSLTSYAIAGEADKITVRAKSGEMTDLVEVVNDIAKADTANPVKFTAKVNAGLSGATLEVALVGNGVREATIGVAVKESSLVLFQELLSKLGDLFKKKEKTN
jgi:hypothetical protein